MQANAFATLTLERLPAVIARTGLSRSELFRQIKAGRFPASVKISARSSAWDSRAVDAWILDRLASREARVAA